MSGEDSVKERRTKLVAADRAHSLYGSRYCISGHMYSVNPRFDFIILTDCTVGNFDLLIPDLL